MDKIVLIFVICNLLIISHLMVAPISFAFDKSELDQTSTGFYYPIGKNENKYSSGGGCWECDENKGYFEDLYHIGVDMITDSLTHSVYAISDGIVIEENSNGWGNTNGEKNKALLIKHKTVDGRYFTCVYGHLQSNLGKNDPVSAGDPLGTTGDWDWKIHLHFGCFWGGEDKIPPTDSNPETKMKRGWGRMGEYWLDKEDKVTGKTPDTNSFVDPIELIKTNSPLNEYKVEADYAGDIAWEPRGVACKDAKYWYRFIGEPIDNKISGYETGISVCDELKDEVDNIIDDPLPQPPDGSSKWSFNVWFRSFLELLWQKVIPTAKAVYDNDLIKGLSDFVLPATLLVKTNGEVTMVLGDGISLSDATGRGYQSLAVETSPTPNLPDFITYDLRLTDDHDVERYTYYPYDGNIEMHHWSTNIGEADWAGDADDIYIRFYLSKGYKARNGDDDWVRVGSEQIKKGHLNVGDINHEWAKLDLPDYFDEGYLEHDGVYNIVVCIDREKDTNNGDGEVPEMHKSNNCTSEAVFIFKESPIPPAEREALVALYDSTNGSGWTNNTDWKTDSDPCSWYGVGCSDGHVNGLSFYDNQLIGSIPPSIENLERLERLTLNRNQLTGEIPSEIGTLSNLETLLLENNRFTGQPFSVLKNLINLRSLSLHGNEFTGVIPPEICDLYKLTSLSLCINNFTGEIPADINKLGNLRSLSLCSNGFIGEVPSEIYGMNTLTYLNLSYNNLTGEIPSAIGNLTNLEHLYLSGNQFTGEIPSEIGELTNLVYLQLMENNLTGEIPTTIGNLRDLEVLSLGVNQLSGEIPSEICTLSNLSFLTLYYNNFTGELPSTIGNLKELEYLQLTFNQLSGEVPSGISELDKLLHLSLNQNRFTKLPSSISSTTSHLYIDNNNLSFDSIEPFMDHTFELFQYAPQAKVTVSQSLIELFEGDTLTLSVNTGGENNHYQWYKYGVPISSLSSNPEFSKPNVSINDSGIYFCVITNSIVTDLVLNTEDITVTVSKKTDPSNAEIFINFTTVPPAIDGNIGTDEWIAASKMTLMSTQGTQCVFYIMHDNDYVYIAASAVDDSTNTTPVDTYSTGIFDNIAIWLGKDGAKVQDGETGYGYWLYGNSYLRTNKINWKDNLLPFFQSAATGRANGPPSSPNMNYELKIPKQEISDAITNGIARVGIHYWNDYNSGPSFWGPSGVNVFDIETYGKISFLTPTDINSDGKIDLRDSLDALKLLSGMLTGDKILKKYDINDDGKVGLEEAIHSLQIVTGERLPITTKKLIITFEPNDVTPTWNESKNEWYYYFTYKVYNPNDFPVEILAWGQFNECLSNIQECTVDPSNFQAWLTSCGEGSMYVPAKGYACDNSWWNYGYAKDGDVTGKYAVWYKDKAGNAQVSVSENLTLRQPPSND